MEIIINKDLRKVETKDVGNFTFKQLGFAIGGMAIALASSFLQRKLTGDFDLILCGIPALPVFLIGFLKIRGMPLIEYIRTVFPEKFLMPKSLKWESDFSYTEDTAKEIFGEDFEKIPFNGADLPLQAQKSSKNNRKKNKK